MRMKAFLKMLVAMVAMFAAVACSNDQPPQDRPICDVSVEVVAITDTTLEFSITSKSADEVRYIFAQSSEAAPTQETILAEGTEVDINKRVVAKFENLAPETKYILHVAAKNADSNVYAYQEAETEETTGVTLSFAVTDITECSAKLTITSENANEVKYLVALEADGLPSQEDVEAYGESVESNAQVEVTISDLMAGAA